MRARAPPRSAGLLNGDYDKHGGKIARYNRGTLARLAAAAVALLAVWLVAMYAFSPASGGGEGDSVARDSKKKHKHEDKGSRHKRHSHKHVQTGCTASPLQEKDAFPVYGCAEMEVRSEREREGDTILRHICPCNRLIGDWLSGLEISRASHAGVRGVRVHFLRVLPLCRGSMGAGYAIPTRTHRRCLS